ncbi:MAG TPA: response regulator transcription factor [Rhodothermales bacterium]|nr:response regulator transcription factor [Rhodothermales bacterium]
MPEPPVSSVLPASVPSGPPSPVRLALVEDHPDLRRHLVARLGFFDDVEVVTEAGSAEALLAALAALPEARHPQVVLMDIGLPGRSGIEATAEVRVRYPHVDVLMLTVFEDPEHLLAAVQAGASGYLLKDVSTSEIVDAVHELVRGGAPMTPVMARRILQHIRQAAGSPGPCEADPVALSKREYDVLQHIVDDASYDEIAEALFVSPHTIRSHVKNIFRKLHVTTRAAAVREALQRRMV